MYLHQVFSLVSCGGGDDKDTKDDKDVTVSDNADDKNGSEDIYTLGDFVIAYKGAKIAFDDDGYPSVIITVGFTNNSDSSASCGYYLYAKAEQGGEFMYPSTLSANEYYSKTAEPGETIDVTFGFVLNAVDYSGNRNYTDAITLSIENSTADATCSVTIDPATLTNAGSSMSDTGAVDGDNTEMENYILNYKNQTDKKYERIVTRFACQLTHPARNQETSLGNLIADILKDSFGVDIMLMGSGAIRNEKLGPVVRYADLCEFLAYDNAIYMLTVTGSQLERMRSHIMRYEAFLGDHTEFYQFSHGIRMVWSRSAHRFETLDLDGKPLDPDGLYTVALPNYHYQNLPEFLNITLEEIEKNAKIRVLATSYRDVVEEAMMKHPHLSREVEGQLVVI